MNYSRRFTLLAWLLLWSGRVLLCAQSGDFSFQIRSYSREKGLSQSVVNCMLQDARGFIWMGTSGGGMSRFDGQRFIPYKIEQGLPCNDIKAADIDAQGRIWMAAPSFGLVCYDGMTFKTYGKQQGVPTDGLWSIFCANDGSVWFTSEDLGVYRWNGRRCTQVFGQDTALNQSAFCLLPISKDTLWVGTGNGIIQVVDYQAAPLDTVRYPNAPIGMVACMTKLRDGTIIGGTENHRYWQYSGNGFVFDTLPESVGRLKDILEDTAGYLWFAGREHLACKSPTGFRKFDTDDGFKEVLVECLMLDADGNIWAGTYGAGAYKISREPFSLLGAKTPFVSRAVFSIAQMGPDEMLVGTEYGLYEVNEDEVNEVLIPGLSSPNVNSIAKTPDGDIYFGLNHDCVRLYRNGRFEKVLHALDGKQLMSPYVSTTPEGSVIGFDKGLVKIEGTVAKRIWVPESEREREDFRLVLGGTGNACYLGADNLGVLKYQGGKIQRFKAPTYLTTDYVVSILEDRNQHLWVGTYESLNCIRKGSACYLTAEDGLAGNVIYCLVEDKTGNIWVGTDYGVSKITLGPDSEVMQVRSYGIEDGFIGLECNQGAAVADDQGQLWFGTIEGLATYHPERDIENPNPPLVQITSAQLELQHVDWAARGFKIEPWSGIPINPIFEPDENHLRIEFTGVTNHLPEKVLYRYRMLGLDDQYSTASSESHATFPYLPPGKYTFEVMASTAGGAWSKEPARFHFEIRSPFYRTTWFNIVAFFAIVMLLVFVVWLRTNSLQKQRAILERKVSQRTEALEQANQVKGEFLAKMSHEIRTPMNGVIGMTDLLERTQLTPQQRKFVENIRVSGQNLLNLINDILDFSRIESGKMELEHIPFEMRHLIEEVMDILAFSAFSKGLEMLYWVDPEIRGPVLGDPARMKQILTNLIGNSIKFTAKGDVTVRVKLVKLEGETALLQVSVKDTGIGIPKEKHATLFESFTQVDASTTRKYGGTGLGLAISYNLSKMMGGQMWVESEAGQGTEFFFTFQGGISEPWKYQGDAHPAKSLEGKKVVLAMQNPSMISLITEYLQHWRVRLEVHSSLEAATDAALDQPDVDFLLIDLRLAHGEPQIVARGISSACKRRKLQFALMAEPDIAIILQNFVGENGWVLSKPLKRDDLLQALMGQRATNEAVYSGDQTQQFAASLPLRILVAEDNPINQDVANGMLGSLGYTVVNTVNGLETVEEVRKGNIDLVFMDVQMPVMDGLEATRIIVSEQPREKRPVIVAMTANAMESDRQRCLDAGMDTFISKPFLMNELVKVLHSVQGLRAGQVPAAQEPQVATPEPIEASPIVPVTSKSGYKHTDMAMLDAVSGGEPAFVLGILSKLVVKLPEAVEELRAALAAEDWETIRATSHRTKSSAAYSGSEALKEKFKELEHIARERDGLDQIPAKLDALDAFVTEVVEELRRHIAERS